MSEDWKFRKIIEIGMDYLIIIKEFEDGIVTDLYKKLGKHIEMLTENDSELS